MKKQILSLLLIVCLLTSALSTTALTATDSQAPVIDEESLTISRETATAGDVVAISVNVTDDVAIDRISISFWNLDSDEQYNYLYMTQVGETDTYSCDFVVTEFTPSGTWTVRSILAYDTTSNVARFDSFDDTYAFEVTDTSPSTIIGTDDITIDKEEVTLGETVTISIRVDGDNVDHVSFDLNNVDSGKSLQFLKMTYDEVTERYIYSLTIDEAIPSGFWNIAFINARDKYDFGIAEYIGGTEIGFTVVRTSADAEAPVIDNTTLSINNDEIESGESAVISVNITDNDAVSRVVFSIANEETGKLIAYPEMSYNADTDRYEYIFEADETIPSGHWQLCSIHAYDVTGNLNLQHYFSWEYYILVKGENDHVWETDAAVESTCTSTGLTEGLSCSICGKVQVAQEVVPMKSHDFSDRTKQTCANCWEPNPNYSSVTIIASGTCGAQGDNLIWTLDSKGVLKISGEGAMMDCDGIELSPWIDNRFSIETVVVEEGVTTLGTYAFTLCSNLKNVTIPGSVTFIDDEAFTECHSITAVDVETSNAAYKDIDGVLFSKDGSRLIHYPVGKTETSYTIPHGVISIEERTFQGCRNLIDVTIPESVISIERAAFNASGLTNITIPDSVTNIGNSAFSSCIALTSVNIKNGVINIGDSAFVGCFNLNCVTIGDNVISIGDTTFSCCNNLTSIFFLGDAPEFGRDIFLNVTATAYYPVNNTTWTESVLKNYGGTITWIAASCEMLGKSHTPVTDATVPPTCTSTGLTEGSHCNVCGKTLVAQEIIPMQQHDFSDTSKRTCVNCDESNPNYIQPHIHKEIIDYGIAATCTKTGLSQGAHCDCGVILIAQQIVPVIPHDFSNTSLQTCVFCSAPNPNYIYESTHSHTTITTIGISATCTSNGITQGVYCSDCGEILVEQEMIPMMSHDFSRAEIPTCINCNEPNPFYKHYLYIDLPFVDMSDTVWYNEAVKYVYANGLMIGTKHNEFSPDETASRATLIVILARMAGINTNNGKTWYDAAVNWAKSTGVSDGTNLFGNITREQLITMLWRTIGRPMSTENLEYYNDAQNISNWAYDAMCWAVSSGIIQGNGNGSLKPNTYASRAEVAEIIMNYAMIQ